MAKYNKSVEETTVIFDDLLAGVNFTNLVERIMGTAHSVQVDDVRMSSNRNPRIGMYTPGRISDSVKDDDDDTDTLLEAA